MPGIDIIGDIHGHADALVRLLREMGYREQAGAWRHPERRAVFVGDFVDRGPDQETVLSIVRGMCEAGSARAIMGNHEYNAICFATPDPERPGEHLRPHTERNRRQHGVFLEQLEAWSERHHEWVDWFRGLPLWLDLNGVRVVHACWHPYYQAALRDHIDEGNRLTHDGLVATTRRGTEPFEAVETLLKGPEVPLPAGHWCEDKGGTRRTRVRVAWWRDEALTYREGAVVPEAQRPMLPDVPLPPDTRLGYSGHAPVFIGHYWLDGEPRPLHERIACVDYSVAKGDKLVAYRWDGETNLSRDRFIWVPS